MKELPSFADQKSQVIFANNIKGYFVPWVLPEPFNTDCFSLLQGGNKLIQFSKGSDQLYDLTKDPQETINIIAQEGSIGSALQKDVKAYIEKYSDRRLTKKDIPKKIDNATLESLRNLGYIQ